MKPAAVIYFINFFHVAVIKLRERKVAKRRLTLISLHFFSPHPYPEFMAIAKLRCHSSRVETFLTADNLTPI